VQNYIPDVNRFSLAGPPQWFLQKLWEFDPSLVIVPSRQSCVYRLGQKRKLKLPEKMVHEALFNQSDTKMLASYGLIPVTSIIPTIEWSDPQIFIELNNRAPHRLGGADAAIKALEAAEAKNELLKRARTDDMLQYLAKDSWNLYNKKIGTRTHMYRPRTKSDVASISDANRSAALRIKKASSSGVLVHP
jgi:hypothetical protein